MRSLVSNIVTEDYVVYAELAGVDRRRILSSYVMRNALVPQVTGLAMSLGGIFNGAIITEKVFGYPGIGTLLVDAVYAGDYGLVLGVTTISIIGVSVGVLVIDLALSAARSARAGALSDARDPARPPALQRRVPHRRCCWSASSSCCAALSFVSPYPPHRRLCRAAGRAAVAGPIRFGTTSRGQDVFWQLTFAHPQHAALRHRGRHAQPGAVARDRAARPATRAAGSTAC